MDTSRYLPGDVHESLNLIHFVSRIWGTYYQEEVVRSKAIRLCESALSRRSMVTRTNRRASETGKLSRNNQYSTIYRAIYSRMFDEKGKSHGNRGGIRRLRHKGKSRHRKGCVERRGKIPISHPIEERPEAANSRVRIGDWEADTVAGITGKACMVTLVDRKSRFLVRGKASIKKAKPVADVIIFRPERSSA